MRDRRFGQNDEALVNVGERVDLQGRAQEFTEKYQNEGHDLRDKVDAALDGANLVTPANSNITSSTLVGAIATGIVYAIEDYAPVRIGAESDIADVEVLDNGKVKYTVDADAPIESQARFRAVLDSTTGLTSLWTDNIEVESMELVNKRTARDTYRYEITVSV